MPTPSKLPERLYELLIADLRGRSGIGDQFSCIDADVEDEFRKTWVGIIRDTNATLLQELEELRKDKARLEYLIEWLGFNEDISQMPVRDWEDAADARKAIDEALTTK